MTRTHWILIAFLALLGGAGGLAFLADRQEEEPRSVGATAPAIADDAVADVDVAVADPVVEEPSKEADLGFDTVFIEPDGTGVVSGMAEPGAVVSVRVAGDVVAEAEADESGAFVAFVDLGASDAPRVMSLTAGGGDAAVEAGQTVIVAPIAAPIEGAEAVTEPVSTDTASIVPEAEGTAVAEVHTGPEAGLAEAESVAEQTDTDLADAAEVVEAAEETAGAVEGSLPDTSVDVSVAVQAPDAPEVDSGDRFEAGAELDPVVADLPEPEGPAEVLQTPEQAEVVSEDAVAALSPEIVDENLSVPALGEVEVAAAVLPEVGSSGSAPDVDLVSPGTGFGDGAATLADPTVDVAQRDLSEGSATSVDLLVPALEADPNDAPQPDVVAEVASLDAPEVTTGPATPPVLLADADGVRILQPALAAESDAEVLRTVALDAISYDPSGDVVLAGRASGGGTVRVYLDNSLLTEAGVADDGTWTSGLPGVETGVYTLRVDQISADGSVRSRIETPFRREEREVIAAVLSEDLEQEGVDVAVRTVQPGNTLWGISQERYGQGILYVQVFEANRDLIRDPDLIYPGQILRIPDGEE